MLEYGYPTDEAKIVDVVSDFHVYLDRFVAKLPERTRVYLDDAAYQQFLLGVISARRSSICDWIERSRRDWLSSRSSDGIGHKDLAEQMGVDYSTINRWINLDVDIGITKLSIFEQKIATTPWPMVSRERMNREGLSPCGLISS